MACSGGATNLINHLRVHHHAKFKVLSGTDTNGAGQSKIVEFYPLSHKTSINKLGAGSKQAQELTGEVVEFIVRDLCPVRIIDCTGFLHLMEVAKPRYVVPCHRTITSYIDKQYTSLRNAIEQELKDVKI